MKNLETIILKTLYLISILLITCKSFAESKPISVIVTQLPEQSWQLEYQLPKAVKQLRFYREGDLSREDWVVFDENLILQNLESKQSIIKSTDGSLFESFKIQFNSNFNHLNKDYELNLAFSDGGLALYTGHLLLSLDDESIEHLFKFIPRKGNHAIVKGDINHSELHWTDTDLQGTYVYFGATKPLKTQHMVAVLDQELPEWIRQKMMQDLPKIFDYFTHQFKQSLEETPLILFSYKTTEQSGTQYSGGALPGVIQMNLTGKDWQQKSKQNLEGFTHFIAHEAAHLWNAQMIPLTGDHADSWIHEGSAEYFSLMALNKLGVYLDKDVLAENEKYINFCIDDLNNHAVTEFDKHQNFGAFYSCGAVIAWISDLAIKAQASNDDLFDLWADLIQRIKQKELELTAEQYFKSLLRLTDNNKSLIHIISLLEEPQNQAFEFFSEVFKSVNINLKANHKHPKKAQSALQTSLKHLMISDCQTYSFQDHISYYTVGEVLTCQTLKPGMKISKIEGLALNNGHEIHHKVQQLCRENMSVQLQTLQNHKLNILCNKSIPLLKPWLAIETESLMKIF